MSGGLSPGACSRGTAAGITGSNGKTVIKEWIAEELPAGMKCYRSPKSYNSQLGVPLSVLMIEGALPSSWR